MDYKKCGEPHVHPLPEGNTWHSEGIAQAITKRMDQRWALLRSYLPRLHSFSPGETSRQSYLLPTPSQIRAFGTQEILPR